MKLNIIFGLIAFLSLAFAGFIYQQYYRPTSPLSTLPPQYVDSEAIYNTFLDRKAKKMLIDMNESRPVKNNKVYAVFFVKYTCDQLTEMTEDNVTTKHMIKYSPVIEIENWNDEVKNMYLGRDFSTINCTNRYKQHHRDYDFIRDAKTFETYSEASEWRYQNLVKKYSQE